MAEEKGQYWIRNPLNFFAYTQYFINIFSCYNYTGLENNKAKVLRSLLVALVMWYQGTYTVQSAPIYSPQKSMLVKEQSC